MDAVVGRVQTAADPLVAEWFRAWDIPALVVHQDLAVVSINTAGRRLIDRETDLRIFEGRLRFVQESDGLKLSGFLTELSSRSGIWSVRTKSGAFRVFRIRRIEVENLPPAFGLSIISSARPPERVWADLSVPFNLTPSEERVARHLFDGLTASELASAMGITLETARTYIRRIYVKTGASSREKLHRVLAPFQLT